MADIIGQVKASCLASLEHSGIAFDDAGQRAFLEQLDEADWKKHFEEHGAKFPLQYSSILEELNFLSILTLLNFLSAYRVTLHKRTGKGAYDTIRRFMMGCFLQAGGDGESPLSAKGMAGLSESAVSDMLDLPILTEKDHQTLPVKIGERDPEAVEIVGLVLKAMNETGAILLQKGHADLGSFVADMLRKAEAQTSAERTNTLVQALVTTFPAFADEGTVKGHPVKVYKKAQLLAFIVATEFSDRGTSAPFPLPDASVVPACVDNVLPTMAVHFKLIDVSRSAYPVFSNGLGAPAASSDQKAAGLRLSHEEAYAIRAATLAACERVVSLTGEIADKTGKEWLRSMTAMNLDGYLWQKAKDGELRNLPRLSEPNTYFY